MVTNKIPLAVQRYGHGTPIIFLHGWGTHHSVWQDITKNLLAKSVQSYQICLVDLPGYGDSPKLMPYSMENIVRSLRHTFSSELSRGAIHLVGWSWGGQIAMHWAAEYPAEIQKLVLVATSPHWLLSADWPHGISPLYLERFHDELSTSYTLTIQRFLNLQVLDSHAGRTTLTALKSSILQRPPPDAQALAIGLGLLQTSDYRPQIAPLNLPCYVFAGGRDRLAPWQASAWLAQNIPNADWHCFETSGHAPFLSHPEEFTDRLLNFLQKDR